jgi:hypothetical protein
MGHSEKDEELANLPPGISSCEYLELRDSKLSDHDIMKTMQACRVITSFMYEMGWGWCNPRSHRCIKSSQKYARKPILGSQTLYIGCG